MYHWLLLKDGAVNVQILQTLVDRNRRKMLPNELTTEDVKPRDRHEHKHMEAVMAYCYHA